MLSSRPNDNIYVIFQPNDNIKWQATLSFNKIIKNDKIDVVSLMKNDLFKTMVSPSQMKTSCHRQAIW